jgi:RNA polymerase sigma factor (sigma-70 family)
VSPRFFGRLSDEHLGSRLALGEAAAFDELYRRYVHRLAAYGTHLLGDASSGDDVAQVALMRAYQSLRGGRAPATLRPWLYRIAHNAAIDIMRGRQELPTDLVPDRAAAVRDPAAAGALVTAVAALPERQRHVYVLRELHGMRIDETAAELGLSGVQVEQALFAARNRLAEQLVFGERLGCATVQRLATGPLEMRERRALKTHLRSCPTCRSELGARGVVLAFLPVAPIEWLQGLLGTLGTGGAAPVAVKVGAAVATATVVASVPIVVDQGHPHVHSLRPVTLARPVTARHPLRTAKHTATEPVTSFSVFVHHPHPSSTAGSEQKTEDRPDGGSMTTTTTTTAETTTDGSDGATTAPSSSGPVSSDGGSSGDPSSSLDTIDGGTSSSDGGSISPTESGSGGSGS